MDTVPDGNNNKLIRKNTGFAPINKQIKPSFLFNQQGQDNDLMS